MICLDPSYKQSLNQSRFHQERAGPPNVFTNELNEGTIYKMEVTIKGTNQRWILPRIQQKSEAIILKAWRKGLLLKERESCSHDIGANGQRLVTVKTTVRWQGVEMKNKYPNFFLFHCLISCQCSPLGKPNRKPDINGA